MPAPRLARWIAAACALAVTGCTTSTIVPQAWTKPGASVQQVTYDDIQCRRAGDDTINEGSGTIVGGFADAILVTMQHVRREQTFARCMEANGYTPVQ